MVQEALAAGVVEEVFVTAEAAGELRVPDGVPVHEVAEHVMRRLCDAATPQGVVAVARTELARLEDVVGRGLLVVLHEVADPGNAGTILRTADGAGAVGVVVSPDSVDVHGPKAVRAAAGSTYHLPVVADVGLDEVLEAARTAGQRLYGLDARASVSVFVLEREQPPLGLVVGNEARGLSAEALGALDGSLAVPLWGGAESLNVAAAAAIALYAAARAVHDPSVGRRDDG